MVQGTAVAAQQVEVGVLVRTAFQVALQEEVDKFLWVVDNFLLAVVDIRAVDIRQAGVIACLVQLVPLASLVLWAE